MICQKPSPQRAQGFTGMGRGLSRSQVGMLRLRIEARFALLNASLSMTTGELIDAALSNQQSTISSLDALALAADQNAGHGMGDFAGLGKRGVGAVPTGMIDVVTGGASLAVAALAAGAAVYDDLVRAGRPVFV